MGQEIRYLYCLVYNQSYLPWEWFKKSWHIYIHGKEAMKIKHIYLYLVLFDSACKIQLNSSYNSKKETDHFVSLWMNVVIYKDYNAMVKSEELVPQKNWSTDKLSHKLMLLLSGSTVDNSVNATHTTPEGCQTIEYTALSEGTYIYLSSYT
jgi:hypothetical protein